MEYDSFEQLETVGQSCKRFSSSGMRSAGAEYVSCGICRNWNGTRCIANNFNNVLTSLEQD